MDQDERRWALLEAGGILGSVLHDITFHHCDAGSWGDQSMFGPASELHDLDDAMNRLSHAITETNHRLRKLRMHVGQRAKARWRADLAALDEQIRHHRGIDD